MSASDGIFKPRKKYSDVPVHRPIKEKQKDGHKEKRTYSANFSCRKPKPGILDNDKHDLKNKYSEVVIEIPERDTPTRSSKKILNKEIARLNQENEELVSKFNELEELSVRRILKLKEKVNTLQNINSQVCDETNYVKQQYEDLLISYEDAKNLLEINKFCKNCDELKRALEKVNAENEALRLSNKELKEDLDILKTVVFRLNLQLERYQEKLRQHNLMIQKYPINSHSKETSKIKLIQDETIGTLSSEHRGHGHTPISWGKVNAHTLGPLLDAYQDTINEKEEIIQNYEDEISKFTGKLKKIIEENELLYKKLTEDENCSGKLSGQLDSLKQELKLVKDQNDALIKKCAIKQDKIEEILRIYETKVEQMRRDYAIVHDEYIKLRTENASLKERNRSLTDVQDDFKNERHNYIPLAVHTSSVNECKKLYEVLKVQYENEKTKLKDNIESQAKVIADLNVSIISIKKNKEDLEAKINRLEKEIKKSEAKQLDLEHTLNEVQLSRSACRKQLHKAMCFAKDMVAEQETLLKALNQRHLENKAVKKIGSQMAIRMDSLKTQLKDVQKSAWHEFSTVEQKIQEQSELIENMKEEHEKEVEKLQKIIVEQEHKKSLTKPETIPLSHYQLFKDKYK